MEIGEVTRGNRQIKAIPTVYRGIEFDSRTEAKWACFLDHLVIRWEREHEGFVLPNGEWYLIDYWLPDLQFYMEIKGPGFTEAETRRCAEVCVGTGFPVLMLAGGPQNQPYEMFRAVDGEAMLEDYEFEGNVAAAVLAANNEQFGRRKR